MALTRLICVLVLAVYISSSVVWAQQADGPRPCESGLTVFFGNGIDTLWVSAFMNRVKLREVLEPSLPESLNNVQWEEAYNKTDGRLRDFYQSAMQRFRLSPSEFWRWYLIRSLASPEFQEALSKVEQQFIQDAAVTDPDLSVHVTQYRNEIQKGRMVGDVIFSV